MGTGMTKLVCPGFLKILHRAVITLPLKKVWPQHLQLSGSESPGEWSRAEHGSLGPARKGEEHEFLQPRSGSFLVTGRIKTSKDRSQFLLGGITEATLRNYLQNWTVGKCPY